jgi:hypothetical protein
MHIVYIIVKTFESSIEGHEYMIFKELIKRKYGNKTFNIIYCQLEWS